MLRAINNWFINNGVSLSRDDMRLALKSLQPVTFPKGAVLMPQDEPVQHLYFIHSGTVRLFRQTEQRDITIDFVPEGEFAALAVYIMSGKGTPCGLEALTDVQGCMWTRETLAQLRKALQGAAPLEMAMQLRVLEWCQNREISRLELTPEKRYQLLFENSPQVVQQIPHKYIASFLGIHEDSLSRLRRKRTLGT